MYRYGLSCSKKEKITVDKEAGSLYYVKGRKNLASFDSLRPWRNRQTRTFEGRVDNTVLVQVQSGAP